jgi:predicted CopG family antitoxin
MATTIQISSQIHEVLKKFKANDKETFNEVLFNILENAGLLEFSDETKNKLAIAKQEISEGLVIPHSEIRKKYANSV